MNLADRIALANSGVMRNQVRVGVNVEFDAWRPACDRVQAGVGNRIAAAQQVCTRGEVPLDNGEAGPQTLPKDILP
jgi:hypothetical protein